MTQWTLLEKGAVFVATNCKPWLTKLKMFSSKNPVLFSLGKTGEVKIISASKLINLDFEATEALMLFYRMHAYIISCFCSDSLYSHSRKDGSVDSVMPKIASNELFEMGCIVQGFSPNDLRNLSQVIQPSTQ